MLKISMILALATAHLTLAIRLPGLPGTHLHQRRSLPDFLEKHNKFTNTLDSLAKSIEIAQDEILQECRHPKDIHCKKPDGDPQAQDESLMKQEMEENMDLNTAPDLENADEMEEIQDTGSQNSEAVMRDQLDNITDEVLDQPEELKETGMVDQVDLPKLDNITDEVLDQPEDLKETGMVDQVDLPKLDNITEVLDQPKDLKGIPNPVEFFRLANATENSTTMDSNKTMAIPNPVDFFRLGNQSQPMENKTVETSNISEGQEVAESEDRSDSGINQIIVDDSDFQPPKVEKPGSFLKKFLTIFGIGG